MSSSDMITKAFINQNALINNILLVKSICSSSRLMAVLKDNAYGHGFELFQNKEIEDLIDYFAVSRVNEGIELRNLGISKPVILFYGIYNKVHLEKCIEYNIHPIFCSLYQVEIALKYEFFFQSKIWIELDTGMNRSGITNKDFDEVHKKIIKKNNNIEINLITQFCTSDKQNDNVVQLQENNFSDITSNNIKLKSALCSAGIINYPNLKYDIIRPGLLIYGVSPMNNISAIEKGFKPVMTLKSKIIDITGEGDYFSQFSTNIWNNQNLINQNFSSSSLKRLPEVIGLTWRTYKSPSDLHHSISIG